MNLFKGVIQDEINGNISIFYIDPKYAKSSL